MWLFSCLLLLQLLCCTVHGFLRLGTVGVSGTTGTVYLIDSNSLFLLGFTSTESLVFKGISGSSDVTATTGGALSSANMLLDGNDNWLSSSTIEVRTVSGDQLLTSFQVPSNIQVPCSAEYLGKFAKSSGGTSHSLAGHVFYDRLNRRLFVAGLFLDGSAPAAYMWLDTSATPSAAGKIAGYNGAYGRVDDVSNQDANVTVPVGYTQTTFRSLSVWCEQFFVSFGHVEIPVGTTDSFDCSSTFGPVQIGSTPAVHSVTGNVYVLGPNTIGLNDLNFDGTAPATHYWAGKTNDVHTGFIVPSHTGSLSQLGALSNAKVVLTLPTDFDVCSTSFLSLYCVQAAVSFGEVFFNTSFGCSNCPPICKTVSQSSVPGFQCKELSTEDRVEYLYDSTNSLVTFKLHTCSLEANQYFAFGLSAIASGTSMAPNADVVVCQFTTTGEVNCTDYDLSIRSQCALFGSNYFGACPDHVLVGGVNNYINTQVERVDGLTTFTTTRAVTTSDSHDKAFTPGTPQYIIWAKGGTFSSPFSDRWVLRHAPTDRATTSSPIQIDFGATSSCANSLECPTTTLPPVTPWVIPPLCIDSNYNSINASIGNTGGRQGYKGITGKDGWGIAWYLNGRLIPEIYVLRGTTVKFFVNGGDDPSNSAQYHPFYLTSSDEGGVFTLAQAGLAVTETVYAGLEHNQSSGEITNLSVGPYCEWTETQGIGDNFNSFEEYHDTLVYSCNAGVSAGTFEWATDANTNSLLYYQCATHKLLGWKIKVVDSLDFCWQLNGITNATTPASTTTGTSTTGTSTTGTSMTTTPATTTGQDFQCQELSTEDRVEYLYDSTNSLVTFKLHTCSLEANQYFAFGLSAIASGTSMAPNADVVVCQFTTTGEVNCTDYDLSIRSQCALLGSNYFGACPDHVLVGGVNNYINTQVERVDGLTTFTTTRAVTTSDSHDKAFTPGTPQYIIWAKGGTFSSPFSDRWVLRHAPTDRATTSSPIQIDFGATSSCANSLECPTTTLPPVTPWVIPPLCIDSNYNSINASIGNTGGRQGYKGITGKDGWGIAWYLNGRLIPEIYVLRGTTVKFFVNGGDDPSNSAQYHPFYLTSSDEGGVFTLAQAGLAVTETVYAGLEHNQSSGEITNLSVGPYCEWTETQGIGDNFNSFEEYHDTLVYSCNAGVSAGTFEWATDANTNSLLYYQCATHKLLGWKIKVVDSLDFCWQLNGITNATTPASTTTGTSTTGTSTTGTSMTTTPATTTGQDFQCQELSTEDRVEYLYDSTNSLVTFKLHTCSLEANQYFAFGLSAIASGTSMAPNADVVVCQFTTTGEVNCTDYDLSIRSQCALLGSNYFGACPDHVLVGGVNNYINTQVERVDGLTTFTTTRAVTTSDSHDKAFTPGTPQYIIWAKGGTFSSPFSDRWVLRHAPTDRATTSSPIQIDFGATSSCANSLQCLAPPQSDTPWSVPPICIDDSSDVIQASLGSAGGIQGYNAITGREGWDIAWYLNGLLIPEVYVLRGSTVKFDVNGGDSPSNRAEYHLLYITSSNVGGISSLLDADQEITETVYAGLAYNRESSSVTDLTVGPYCEWEETQGSGGNFNTFKAYRETLRYSCSANVAVGSFEWTTDNDTSDVVYYQCATHPLYGWKIRVVNSLDGCLQLVGNITPTATTPWDIPPICIDAEDSSISAVIGSSNNKMAGNEGRKSIWYLNGLPSPEIYILRNIKVTFYVNGGNDHADPDNFHPLYLTNSSEGGLLRVLQQGLPVNQTVYAGLQIIGGRLVTITDGSLCKYSETQGGTDFESFEEYQETLNFVCLGNIITGEFSWTPDENTPDTIYYQCAQHKDHGMRINVVDDIASCLQQLAASGIILPVSFLLVIGNFLALYYSL